MPRPSGAGWLHDVCAPARELALPTFLRRTDGSTYVEQNLMRLPITLVCWTAWGLVWVPSISAQQPAAQRTFAEHAKPIFSAYCIGCHSADAPEAELDLESFADDVNVATDHDTWIRIAEVIRSEEMPPEDEAQPSADERAEVLAWLEPALAAIDCRKVSQPGRVTIRRLNRTEYNNTVRDLVGVEFRPADDFPADDVGNGFDNIAQVLSLSPLLMEKYLDAAEQIVEQLFDDERLRERLFADSPAEAGSGPARSRYVLQRFARRAFRRPVSAAEIDRLVDLSRLTDEAESWQRLRLPLQAVLSSPHFLYRIELDEESESTEKPRTLNDHELATRLSYFLWSTMPDDELMSLADSNRLHEDDVLRSQIARMLADEKASSLVDNFAGQWLELRNLSKMAPDPEKYPSFDEALREAMRRETEMFFASVIRNDRSILDLIDADYTYANERLAQHYGIPNVQGEEFREVKFTDPRRGGVLTHASILTLTSNPTRTSPVKRGKWILENILGAPPPPPPAGVEELAEGEDAELLGTLRERMEQHRMKSSCAVCHRTMDALGFGFENFDGIGAWRDRDGRFDIDASGELPGNQAFQGPAELRQILKTSRRQQFARCMVEKMLTYALGRALESYDRCTIDEIVEKLVENDYRFSTLIAGIVEGEAFRMRGFKGEVE